VFVAAIFAKFSWLILWKIVKIFANMSDFKAEMHQYSILVGPLARDPAGRAYCAEADLEGAPPWATD